MDKQTKKALLRACRPDEPVPPDDPRHYDFDIHGLRGRPWRQRVIETIQFADGPTAQGVTGLRGSGKTTELQQLSVELERDGHRVVLADAGAWVRDDAPISVETIWLALVLALHPDGRPDGLTGWLAEYARRFWSLLQTRVQLKELSAQIGSNESGRIRLKSELTTDDTLFQRVALHLRDINGLREQIFELLTFAADAARSEGRPLVMLLDGIEKRATGDLHGPEEREKYRSHWFSAFLTRAPDLRLPMHVVYTVPSFMIRRAAEFGIAFGQPLEFLPMVRVWGRERSDAGVIVDAKGVIAMREALLQRLPAECFADVRLVDWLVLHSGGFMRDLLRMATECIYACRRAGDVITRDVADAAITQVRQTYFEDSSGAMRAAPRGTGEARLSARHEQRARDGPTAAIAYDDAIPQLALLVWRPPCCGSGSASTGSSGSDTSRDE
ncbi:MAG: hypothetical protein R3F65_06465 [bacterium]